MPSKTRESSQPQMSTPWRTAQRNVTGSDPAQDLPQSCPGIDADHVLKFLTALPEPLDAGIVLGHFTGLGENLSDYLRNYDPPQIAEHLGLLGQLGDRLAMASIRKGSTPGILEVVMVGQDRPGVGAKVMASLAGLELDVAQQKTHTYEPPTGESPGQFVWTARVRVARRIAQLPPDLLTDRLQSVLGKTISVHQEDSTSITAALARVRGWDGASVGTPELFVSFTPGPAFDRDVISRPSIALRTSKLLRVVRKDTKATREEISTTQERTERAADPEGKDARPVELSPKAQRVFEAVDRMPGADSHTRSEVEVLLSGLEGERCTAALTSALKRLLRARSWGVRCTCGEPATVLWQHNASYVEGGNMKFSHTGPDKRSVTHGGLTTLPKLVLVERWDRRRGSSSKVPAHCW